MSRAKPIYVDPLFEEAAMIVMKEQSCYTSLLQRRLSIGYNRAYTIVRELETAGIIGGIINAMLPRKVLVSNEESLKRCLGTFNYRIVPEYIHDAAILGIDRLRMGTDGRGITVLIAFHDCPLRCKYCLNPECHNSDAKVKRMLPEEVMEEIKKDEFYYIATKGGVTFGGGEPLFHSRYIIDILKLGAKDWNVTVETSLYVPRQHLKLLLPYIDEYIVDIKDMNSETYSRYTGMKNKVVKENQKWLINNGAAKRIVCRIPLITGYNNAEDQQKSQKELTQMGIERFDFFEYRIPENNNKEKKTEETAGCQEGQDQSSTVKKEGKTKRNWIDILKSSLMPGLIGLIEDEN